MVDKITLEAGTEEASRLEQEVADAVKDSQEYVKEHGGKSAEGFFRTDEGPKGVDYE